STWKLFIVPLSPLPLTSTPASRQLGIGILLMFIAAVTTVGNLLVLGALAWSREVLQGVTFSFIGSLAFADLIMGALVMPAGAAYILGGSWRLGELMCLLWNSVDVLSTTASIDTLCVIAMDRYVAITDPLRYQMHLTPKRARFLIAFVWFIAAMISFFPILMGWWRSDDPAACYADPDCCEYVSGKLYTAISSVIVFYMPLSIMVFVYSRVLKEAERQVSVLNSSQCLPSCCRSLPERRALKTLSLVMGVFIACWLPFFICYAIQIFCMTCVPGPLFLFLIWLSDTNSTFNPFLYSRSPEFMSAYKRILCCNSDEKHHGVGAPPRGRG
uniref:G-protein coupled receptors family 1 profile domain-containing protein n=1 Tax=Eptatretus burgeri TaxID=7764 RepID=A0A8C4QHV2_EPTBU